MMINRIFLWCIAISILVGGVDRITGNHLRLGEKFDEGFLALGPLALGMTGILCLAPAIADFLAPVVSPVLQSVGLDPSILSILLSCDMGGFTLGENLAVDANSGVMNGLITASMLGCTLIFSIPVGFRMIEEDDKPFFSKGLLIGLLTVPVGSVVGGLVAKLPPSCIVSNLIPVLILSALLALGLRFIPRQMIRGCVVLGKAITIVIYIGLIAAAFEYVTHVTLIPCMMPITEAMAIVSICGIVLLGTFPFLSVLTFLLKKPLGRLAALLRIDSVSTDCLIYSLANSVPVYPLMKKMKKRGIILNTAWLVSATAALGDHLAFAAGVAPDYIGALILGKLTAGVLALLLAVAITRKDTEADAASGALAGEPTSVREPNSVSISK